MSLHWLIVHTGALLLIFKASDGPAPPYPSSLISPCTPSCPLCVLNAGCLTVPQFNKNSSGGRALAHRPFTTRPGGKPRWHFQPQTENTRLLWPLLTADCVIFDFEMTYLSQVVSLMPFPVPFCAWELMGVCVCFYMRYCVMLFVLTWDLKLRLKQERRDWDSYILIWKYTIKSLFCCHTLTIGLYRDVNLAVTGRVHVRPKGTYWVITVHCEKHFHSQRRKSDTVRFLSCYS